MGVGLTLALEPDLETLVIAFKRVKFMCSSIYSHVQWNATISDAYSSSQVNDLDSRPAESLLFFLGLTPPLCR